jgi:hypothetical protein
MSDVSYRVFVSAMLRIIRVAIAYPGPRPHVNAQAKSGSEVPKLRSKSCAQKAPKHLQGGEADHAAGEAAAGVAGGLGGLALVVAPQVENESKVQKRADTFRPRWLKPSAEPGVKLWSS